MLVLTRKKGERIMIGQDIEVTVREISGRRVQVSVHAPRNVVIRRGELLEQGCCIMTSDTVPPAAGCGTPQGNDQSPPARLPRLSDARSGG